MTATGSAGLGSRDMSIIKFAVMEMKVSSGPVARDSSALMRMRSMCEILKSMKREYSMVISKPPVSVYISVSLDGLCVLTKVTAVTSKVM